MKRLSSEINVFKTILTYLAIQQIERDSNEIANIHKSFSKAYLFNEITGFNKLFVNEIVRHFSSPGVFCIVFKGMQRRV